MKIIVAGSRDILPGRRDYTSQQWMKIYARTKKYVFDTIDELIDDDELIVSEIVSGTAHGVDRLGEAWANAHSINIKRFPADWDTYGRRAGFIRNAEMADYADGLILIWDGKSHGSKMMLNLALDRDLDYVSEHVYIEDTLKELREV
jgi:hypothetical protein